MRSSEKLAGSGKIFWAYFSWSPSYPLTFREANGEGIVVKQQVRFVNPNHKEEIRRYFPKVLAWAVWARLQREETLTELPRRSGGV